MNNVTEATPVMNKNNTKQEMLAALKASQAANAKLRENPEVIVKVAPAAEVAAPTPVVEPVAAPAPVAAVETSLLPMLESLSTTVTAAAELTAAIAKDVEELKAATPPKAGGRELFKGEDSALVRVEAILAGKEVPKLEGDSLAELEKLNKAQAQVADVGLSAPTRVGNAIDRSTFWSYSRTVAKTALVGAVGYLTYDALSADSEPAAKKAK